MSRKRQLPAAAAPLPAVSMELALDDDDLLMLIFVLLPAKTLIRLKSVCKKWLSVISSDDFCHQHTLRGPKLQHSLILQTQPLQHFYFNQTTNGEKVMIPYTVSVHLLHEIVQDCNGLMLLEFDPLKYCNSSYSRTSKKFKKELRSYLKRSYYVYNPTTRRSRKITPINNDNFPCVARINLAFDPSKSPYYKIVCVRSNDNEESSLDSYTYQIEVYDSESHTWKLGFKPFIYLNTFKQEFEGVHWNNSIYWSNIRFYGDRYFIFDIAKNEMKTLDPPPYPFPYEPGYDLGDDLQESNGHLYYSECLFETSECCARKRVSVVVWELGGDDHSQWLLKHHAKFHQCSKNSYRSLVRFMGGSEGGETCSLLWFERDLGRVMAYNFLDKRYEALVDVPRKPDDAKTFLVKGFQFGEILALV